MGIGKTVFFIAIVVSLALAVFCAYMFNECQHFRNLVPHLAKGESLPVIPFINGEDQPVDFRNYEDKPLLLFVFERPCSTCTKNIAYWSKLNELAHGRAHVFGVITDRADMLRISGYQRMPFVLIAPVDFNEFVREWRARLNLSQTYLVEADRVRWVRLGDLRGTDMREIMKVLHEPEAK